uniref:X-box-binding protein 1 n=1 Tax=Caenorhabditis japonica TaxID=281687 RepID=A0A8R1DUJ8_CAEJA
MSYPQRIYVLPARQTRPAPMQYAIAPKQALKRPRPTEAIVAELLGDDMGLQGPRKRERLSHLTAEEKMDRRKMKNRVAAQNARDKKKERSAKVEDVMRDLVEENRRLRAENEILRRNNEHLLQQQSQQQVQIQSEYERNENRNDSNIYQNVVYEEEVVGEVDDGAFESAAFINVPLPRDKVLTSTSSRMTSNKKTINMETYLTIVTILCNHMGRMSKAMNNSSKSSKISKAHLESSIDLLLSTLKKKTATRRHRLQDSHLQKHAKHFRRVH